MSAPETVSIPQPVPLEVPEPTRMPPPPGVKPGESWHVEVAPAEAFVNGKRVEKVTP